MRPGLRQGCRHAQLTRQASALALTVAAVTVASSSRFSWPSAAAGAAPADSAAGAAVPPCVALHSEVMSKVWPRVTSWEKTALSGRTVLGFGGQSSRLINRTLAVFDAEVEAKQLSDDDGCARQREEIEELLKRQVHSIFLVQRSTIEQVLYQRLKKDLLRRMQRKKRELTVKEKLRLLQSCMNDYDSQVRELLPFFVDNTERDRAERRLSRLQWGIHEFSEAKDMQQRWKMDRMRKAGAARHSRGLSVSLSPGLRLMFRPPGFGNFQVYSRRQVGPMHNPNEIAIGVLNDGHVVDVYNKATSPPLIKFQPTVGVDVSAG